MKAGGVAVCCRHCKPMAENRCRGVLQCVLQSGVAVCCSVGFSSMGLSVLKMKRERGGERDRDLLKIKYQYELMIKCHNEKEDVGAWCLDYFVLQCVAVCCSVLQCVAVC